MLQDLGNIGKIPNVGEQEVCSINIIIVYNNYNT